MAKGQIAKAEIAQKILNSFEGAFTYNDGKEIRIPYIEEGENIQIKVALTCAKENVNPGDDNAIPGAAAIKRDDNKIEFNSQPIEKKVIEPTAEERQNVSDLLKALGL